MPILRRRRLPAALAMRLAAFRAVLGEVDRAKEALTDAVPGTRMPGRPLAEALAGFEEHLGAARDAMVSWRGPELDAEWSACLAAVEGALAVAERLRLERGEPAGFEGLIGAIGDLLEPLDAFDAAADRFRELRVRE